jgi:Chaperone of endosialidase
MEDIIDIIVTETTNLIEITSQPTDEVIDVNIIDNREDITLNVTPSVVEININSLSGNFGVNWGDIDGTLLNQTDLQNALNLKADLVDGKVPSSQLPSYVDDIVEVATYSALPTTGETGKIYVVLDTNLIYRWSGSAYIEIKDSSAVWGAITGTLSSQTDLQNALNAKFDDPTGDTTQYIAGDGSLITFPVAGQAGTLVREVRNTTGATLTKGTIVYISGATGNKPTISKAIATGDSTSAQTFGMLQSDIANNSNGYAVCVGGLSGLDTSGIAEGTQLYLSSTTAGTYTTTKQIAPAHLVYIGVVTRSHPTQGQIEVKIQNGYELDEIHDVLITSKANNDGLFYESSTSLWKNKSIATVLGYTPEQPLTFTSPLIRTTNAISIQVASASQNGYLTSTDWTTFNGKQAALSGTGFVKISGTTISYDNNTYLTGSGSSNYLARWSSTSGVLTDSFVFTNGNYTEIQGQGLTASNGIVVSGRYGSVANAPKIYSSDETTGVAHIEFVNNGGQIRLGVEKSTGGQILPGSSAYATVLTGGLTARNLEFGTNNTKRLTIDGSTGAATFTSSVTATAHIVSGGTSSQFQKGDGSLDSNTYLTTSSASSTYLAKTGGTLTGALEVSTSDLNSIFVTNPTTTGATTGSGLGFKAYNGTSVTQSAGIFLTSNTWSFGTYLANQLSVGADGTGGLALRSANSAPINFYTGGASAGVSTLRLTINSTGAATFSSSVTATQMGLGVSTLPIWTGARAIQAGLAGSFYGDGQVFGWRTGIAANCYRNGNDSWLYQNTGITSSRIEQSETNPFTVFGAPAGTAGNAITFTPLVTVNPAGNVGIGTTSPSWKLDVRGDGMFNGTLQLDNNELNTPKTLLFSANISSGANVSLGAISWKNVQWDGNIKAQIEATTDTDITTARLVFKTGASGASATERMRITSVGNLLVGTTSDVGQKFVVNGGIATIDNYLSMRSTVNSTNYGFINEGNVLVKLAAIGVSNYGQFSMNTGVYTPLSDRNKKKDFEDSTIGLNEIMQLKPTLYRMKTDETQGIKELGFIAQDIKDVIPMAYVESTDFIGLNFNPIVAALTKAVQELKAELDTLKNK